MNDILKKELSAALSTPILCNEPLAPRTSFRVGGEAELLVTVTDCHELSLVTKLCSRHGCQYRVLGFGSNVVVSDSGFAGVIVILKGEFADANLRCQKNGAVEVVVGGGYSLARFSGYCQRHGFSGAEFLCGIPGTMGAAAVMNAGAWGRELADIVVSLEVWTGVEVVRLQREEIPFVYRAWQDFDKRYPGAVIISLVLLLKQETFDLVRSRCRELLAKRRAKQLDPRPNAGSFFKNPPANYAGKLIEECGLKGATCGGAQISHLHGNFMVNDGAATAADIVGLMRYVQEKVRSKRDVYLQPEVHFIGELCEKTN